MEQEDCLIELRAGYGDDLPVIMGGSLTCFETETNGADRQTTIEFVDSFTSARDTTVSLSYSGVVNGEKIVRDVAQEMGCEVKLSPKAKMIDFKNFAFVGTGKTLIGRLCDRSKLRWSVQNGIIQICALDEPLTMAAYVLSADSGMIGSPKPFFESASTSSKSSTSKNASSNTTKRKAKKGIEVTYCLNAESSSVTKKMTVSSYDDAYSQMLAAVQSFDALVKFGIAVSDETDDQGEHSIVLTASGAADSFSATLCKYITVTEVTSNIQFESAEYGSYVLADGVITQIVTTVDGWTACTNDIAPIKGRLTQTDAEARTSYTNRVASRGTGTVASIVSLLYSDVDGVTFAAGYENYNDTTDAAGRPPHSIEIVVQGGSDEDVANIIWKNKAGGIRAYGKHYAYATDINGNRQYLEFTRVNDVYLLLSVTVTSSGGLDDDYAARIKSLLMEEILSAGTTIRLQTFIRPIMESVSGVDYVEIRGLLSEKPDIEGVADNSMLTGIVPVEINQQPVLSMSGIRVVKA